MTKLFTLIGVISATILGTLLSGYAISTMWGWFIVPTFGLPSLSVPAALGVLLVARYMTVDRRRFRKEEEQEPLERIADSVAMPLLTLGVGWVILQWM